MFLCFAAIDGLDRFSPSFRLGHVIEYGSTFVDSVLQHEGVDDARKCANYIEHKPGESEEVGRSSQWTEGKGQGKLNNLALYASDEGCLENRDGVVDNFSLI